MTAYAVIGRPGSGKSLYAVGEHVLKALRQGRLVVTNVPLHFDKLSEMIGHDVSNLIVQLEEKAGQPFPFSEAQHFTDYEKWKSEGGHGYGPLYVVDECHKAFAKCVGLHAQEHPIVIWLAEHRHVGADVVVMTQMRTGIPAAIRGRCEYTYEFRKLAALGFSRRYVRLMFFQDEKQPIDKVIGTYPKKWFGLYKSRRDGVEESSVKQKNVLLNPKVFLILALFVVALGYVITNGLHMPGSHHVKEHEKQSPTSTPTVQPEAAAKTAAAVPADNAEIKSLRDELEKLKLEAELKLYKNSRVPETGLLLPAEGVTLDGKSAGGMSWVAAPKPYAHRYDGVQVKISAHVEMDAQHTYWLDMFRDGQTWHQNAADLQPFGFEVLAIDPCQLWLRSEFGNYRVSCDGYNLIGAEAHKQIAERKENIVVHNADGTRMEQRPAVVTKGP